jgi:hypothetical protein
MAIPASAREWTRVMDPADRVDYKILLSGVRAILGPNEEMANHTLTLSAEAVALGLIILDSGGYAPAFDGDDIQIWLEIHPNYRNHAAFQGAGTKLSMELTFETNSIPARRYQRTLFLTVAQQ